MALIEYHNIFDAAPLPSHFLLSGNTKRRWGGPGEEEEMGRVDRRGKPGQEEYINCQDSQKS